jgi:hypothetical protein
MKMNQWTLVLAATGVVSLAGALQAEERNNPVMTALSTTAISGYVDTAAVWRMGGNNGTGITVPGTIGDQKSKADQFNLNAVGLSLEKPLDEAEWAAGFKVDMVFGPDIVGWNPSWNGAQNADFGLKQAYVELRAPVGNGLDFKLGTFDTIIGYESFESYKNDHWTRSYGFGLEPAQHTGVLMTYEFADWLSVTAGMANTVSSGINAPAERAGTLPGETDGEFTYMGSLTLTAPESMGFLAGSTLSAGVVNGLGSPADPTSAEVTFVYVGATLNTPIKSLKLGAAYDGVYNGDVNGVSQGYAYSVAGYAVWQATAKLKMTGRGEYAKGSNGTWYWASASESFDGSNELLGLTATADYSLWENVITRLEFRFDRDLTNQSQGGPFGDDDNNNYVLALNVIYRF